MPVGKSFLRREKCLGPNGKFLTAYDFKLGETFTLHGRNIYLYDCDEYTREFYEKLSIPQGPSEDYNAD
jgi:EF-hand domain-containing protein 1